MAGFANVYFSAVEPGLEAIYTNTAILGWYLSFQVSRKLSAITIQSHMNTCKKVLEWVDAEVRIHCCQFNQTYTRQYFAALTCHLPRVTINMVTHLHCGDIDVL